MCGDVVSRAWKTATVSAKQEEEAIVFWRLLFQMTGDLQYSISYPEGEQPEIGSPARSASEYNLTSGIEPC